MKKVIVLFLTLCLLLTGCTVVIEKPAETQSQQPAVQESAPVQEMVGEPEYREEEPVQEIVGEPEYREEEPAQETVGEPESREEEAATIRPLADATMDNLSDGIFAIQLDEGEAYFDNDSGKMQMNIDIYSYDVYDMVDIANLKEGDVLVTNAGKVKVTQLQRKEDGAIAINGGLDGEGFELVTDDSGVYFERGFSDVKNWYKAGRATVRVSDELRFTDFSNPDDGGVVYYAGDFLNGTVTDYYFTPYNTTIRIENGEVVEMTRVYIP